MKPSARVAQVALVMSPPTRRRGLKLLFRREAGDAGQVASHAEAWIETSGSWPVCLS